MAARAITDCVCLMVLRDDYLAALREHIAETMAQNVAFLKRVCCEPAEHVHGTYPQCAAATD